MNMESQIIQEAWKRLEGLFQTKLSDKTDSKRTIKTTAPKAEKNGCKPAGWKLEMPNNFSDNLAGLIEQIGAQAVYDAAISSLIIMFQAEVRRLAVDGVSDNEIKKIMSKWMPGQSTAGTRPSLSKLQKALDILHLPSESREKFLELLRGKNFEE